MDAAMELINSKPELLPSVREDWKKEFMKLSDFPLLKKHRWTSEGLNLHESSIYCIAGSFSTILLQTDSQAHTVQQQYTEVSRTGDVRRCQMAAANRIMYNESLLQVD